MALANRPVVALSAICVLFIQNLLPMDQPKQIQDKKEYPEQIKKLKQQLDELEAKIKHVTLKFDAAINLINRASAIAFGAAENSDTALNKSKQALDDSNNALQIVTAISESTAKIQNILDQTTQNAQTTQQAAQNVESNLKKAYDQIKKDFENLINEKHKLENNALIQAKIAKINELQKLGFFEKEAQLKAEATVKAAVKKSEIKWETIKTIINDPQNLANAGITIISIIIITYLTKYGIPYLLDYLIKPQIITETSITGWFEKSKKKQEINLHDLIFVPTLQKQIFDLAVQIKSAKTYNENLPNLLFYGAPGTGKTAFAKALAYYSELDYVITSGSEFAKITNLNDANNEFRKLLNWAKNGKKELIVFIDEAESLFTSRKHPSISKFSQDFINTFLSLVPDKSQKKLMFIFATNQPFKLDDAILDRIGPKIEFVLPQAPERKMILALYLEKFATENENSKVSIDSQVIEKLQIYAETLAEFSPRAIKFVAEEMIIQARRQENKVLTLDLAQTVIENAKYNLQKEAQWEKDRDEWIAALMPVV
jgi:AAA+ superfamily predicted ATPase